MGARVGKVVCDAGILILFQDKNTWSYACSLSVCIELGQYSFTVLLIIDTTSMDIINIMKKFSNSPKRRLSNLATIFLRVSTFFFFF